MFFVMVALTFYVDCAIITRMKNNLESTPKQDFEHNDKRSFTLRQKIGASVLIIAVSLGGGALLEKSKASPEEQNEAYQQLKEDYGESSEFATWHTIEADELCIQKGANIRRSPHVGSGENDNLVSTLDESICVEFTGGEIVVKEDSDNGRWYLFPAHLLDLSEGIFEDGIVSVNDQKSDPKSESE